MKKKIAKLLALGMSIALVFSLAACGGTEDPATSSEDTSNQVVDASGEVPEPVSGDEAATGESGESVEDPSAAQGENTPTPGGGNEGGGTTGITSPGSDVNAAVALYNSGISGVSLSGSAVRTLDSASAIVNLLDIPGVREAFDWNSPQGISDRLQNLDAGSVASVSSNVNGDTLTMKFNLKDFHGTHTAAHGAGGFMYFFTIGEAKTIVQDIGHQLGGESFTIQVFEDDKDTFLDLSKGVFTVNVSMSTGKVTSAELSFSEYIEAAVKAPITGPIAIPATAKVSGHGTVNWA